MRTAEELLPYLKEYPEYLEHPTIKRINTVLSTINSPEQVAHITKLIAEGIEEEQNKPDPDEYLIKRLAQLYIKHTKAAE